MYKTIYNFVKSFFDKNKNKSVISPDDLSDLQNLFSEQIKKISLKKELANQVLTSKDFEVFQENFVNTYISLQIKNACNSKDDKEICDTVKKMAGVIDLFTDLHYNSNIDIEKMSKNFQDNVEKRQEFEKYFMSEEK